MKPIIYFLLIKLQCEIDTQNSPSQIEFALKWGLTGAFSELFKLLAPVSRLYFLNSSMRAIPFPINSTPHTHTNTH